MSFLCDAKKERKNVINKEINLKSSKNDTKAKNIKIEKSLF